LQASGAAEILEKVMEQGKQPSFRIDIEIIPPDVDLTLAVERNRIISAWRKKQITAAVAYESLERLYWSTQQITNPETNIYLRRTTYEFPAESGMALDESGDIYQRIQNDPELYPYIRIFE